MKNRRVLVTGVCGLIGSHLLDELLVAGECVTGVDNLSFGKMENIRHHLKNKNFRFLKLDVTDADKLLKKAGPVDVIVHLAAVKKTGEKDLVFPTLLVNTVGTESVLGLAKKRHAKLILGSTSDVYGASGKVPFREDSESVLGASTAKRWAYAVSKLFCEHLALGQFKDRGVPVVVLRYFGCFSERSNTSWSGGHIPIFIDAILKGEPVVIHGNGKQTRSMAHVSDVVRGTLLAMDSPKAVGEIINIGSDEEVSVLDSVKLIARIAEVGKPRIRFVPMKKLFGSYREIPRRRPDLSKAWRLLGYRPRVAFSEALRSVIRARAGELKG